MPSLRRSTRKSDSRSVSPQKPAAADTTAQPDAPSPAVSNSSSLTPAPESRQPTPPLSPPTGAKEAEPTEPSAEQTTEPAEPAAAAEPPAEPKKLPTLKLKAPTAMSSRSPSLSPPPSSQSPPPKPRAAKKAAEPASQIKIKIKPIATAADEPLKKKRKSLPPRRGSRAADMDVDDELLDLAEGPAPAPRKAARRGSRKSVDVKDVGKEKEAAEAKEDTPDEARQKAKRRRIAVSTSPERPPSSPKRAPTPGGEDAQDIEITGDKGSESIVFDDEAKDGKDGKDDKDDKEDKGEKKKRPLPAPPADEKKATPKPMPKITKRPLPPVPKRPAAAAPRPSLLASTLASLSGKTAVEKKAEAVPERPRAGAWTDEFVMTSEQETQFANSHIQRNYSATERAKACKPPLRMQAAKDAYRADYLASLDRGRSINVPGNMGIQTTDLPALMVAAIRAGNVRF